MNGQTLVVDGGAHGIGRDYCLGLAKEGAKVIVADLDGMG